MMEFVVYVVGVWCIVEVEVVGEKFIGVFVREDYFDVLRCEFS